MESDSYHPIGYLLESIPVVISNGGVIISTTVVIILLFISGIVSGSEYAFFSITPGDRDVLKKSRSRIGKLILNRLRNPGRLMATILITKIFVNVALVILSSYVISSMFTFSSPSWMNIITQVVIITFLILFGSEILSKIFTSSFPLKFAGIVAPGLKFLSILFWPVSSVLIYYTTIVNKKITRYRGSLPVHDLSDALELTEAGRTEEKDILKGIMKFGNIDVCDIMRSRVDTIAVDIKTRYDELIRTVTESGYSRIPVYEDSFDQIRGVLYIKDLMPHLDKPLNFTWQNLIRPSFFVPESKKINALLKEFQKNRIHMAIVVDEYGGTSGIVTLEDILEEIVGEITDESDNEPPPYEKIDDHNFIFEGKVLLNDFCKILGFDNSFFDPVKGEADTLAGLILEIRGELPSKDEKIVLKNLIFKIVTVDARRIKEIHVTIRSDEKNPYEN